MEAIPYLITGLLFIAINVVLLILWLVTKKHIFGILLGLFWLWYLIADSETYGSFWADFHEDEISAKIEDSEYNKTIVSWNSEKVNCFTRKEISEHAAANEWQLSDSLVMPFDSLKTFLAKFDRFKSYVNDFHFVMFKENVFRDLSPADYRIYFFATNVQAVSIATSDVTVKNGFAVLSADGKQLRIYHFWGEI